MRVSAWLALVLPLLIATSCTSCKSDHRPALPYSLIQKAKTPEVISEKELANRSIYRIRTRIIIETLYLPNSKSLYGATDIDIIAELKFAEKVFSKIGLQFEVVQWVFEGYDTNYARFMIDAKKYPNTLSIYYMLPNEFPLSGMGMAPWITTSFNNGILVNGSRSGETLAHEIGHYFGLFHPFESTDFCKDTPEQEQILCVKETGGTPNCGNLMGYCLHPPRYLTKDQIDRVLRFLRAKRRDHIMINTPPRINADLSELMMKAFLLDALDRIEYHELDWGYNKTDPKSEK